MNHSCAAPQAAQVGKPAPFDLRVAPVGRGGQPEMTHAAFAENALVDDGYFWRRRKVDVVALAIDDEVHRQTGAHQRRFLKRFKAVDRIPVDRLYQVAGLKSGRRRRAARLDPPDARHMLNPAEGHEHAGKNDEGQDEIRDRPREHDRGPVSQWLTSQVSTSDRPRIAVGALTDAGRRWRRHET